MKKVGEDYLDDETEAYLSQAERNMWINRLQYIHGIHDAWHKIDFDKFIRMIDSAIKHERRKKSGK